MLNTKIYFISTIIVIKQRMQLSGQNKCLSCARSVVKYEGFFALYRSLPITLFMNAPYHITTVIVNENLKKIIEPKKKKFKFLSYFFCAAIAGGFASCLTCPMDNIKTKLQTQSIMSSCEILETKILSQMSKPLVLERHKESNTSSSHQSVSNLNINNNNKLINSHNYSISSAKTNTINSNQTNAKLKNTNNSTSTTNLDTTANKKSKNIDSSTQCSIEEKNNLKYRTIKYTIKSIYNEDGFFKGFFRGVGPRFMFNCPSCAISWGSYEIMKHLLSSNI